MSYTKTIVCFANSKRLGCRCVAGKELQNRMPGPWIRPVTGEGSPEISHQTQRFSDGSDLRPLDIVDITFERSLPLEHQNENHVIARTGWIKRGRLSLINVQPWLDSPETLWGKYESIQGSEVYKGSLFLICVQQLILEFYTDSYGKKGIKGIFSYNDIIYRFSVTDPVIRSEYLPKQGPSFIIQNPILCISLAEFFERRDGVKAAYKLIAAILHEERFQ